MLNCLRTFSTSSLLISLVDKYIVWGRGRENRYSTYSICNSDEVSNPTVWFINRLNLPTTPQIDLVSFLNILLFSIFVESSIIEYISGSKYLV